LLLVSKKHDSTETKGYSNLVTVKHNLKAKATQLQKNIILQ